MATWFTDLTALEFQFRYSITAESVVFEVVNTADQKAVFGARIDPNEFRQMFQQLDAAQRFRDACNLAAIPELPEVPDVFEVPDFPDVPEVPDVV